MCTQVPLPQLALSPSPFPPRANSECVTLHSATPDEPHCPLVVVLTLTVAYSCPISMCSGVASGACGGSGWTAAPRWPPPRAARPRPPEEEEAPPPCCWCCLCMLRFSTCFTLANLSESSGCKTKILLAMKI